MIGNHKVLHLNFIVGFIAILLTNFSLLSLIFDEWNSNGPYSHGSLGFAVVLYVLWLKRSSFSEALHAPSAIASFLFLMSCIGLLITHLASVQQFQLLMLLMVIVSFTASIYSFSILNKLFFPLLMFALILPFWNILQTPLRELSTLAGEIGPRLVGIEVLRNGYLLTTYGGKFNVEPSCSGLGFFLVGALFAACVSFFNNLKLSRSLQFLIICLCFAIFANWVRIIIIIIVGSYTNMQHFVVQDHLTFGWAVFAVFLIPLIYIARSYFDLEEEGNAPEGKIVNSITIISKPHLLITYSILFSFICTLYWIPSRYDEEYRFTLPSLEGYKLASADKLSSPNWFPISYGVSSESFNFIVKEELGIQVYLANYIKQSQGREMIYVENILYDKNRWSLKDQGKLNIGNNQVNFLSLKREEDRSRLIAYWYVINGVHTSSKKLAKIEEVKSTIIGKPGATLIAFSIDYRVAADAKSRQQIQTLIQTFFSNI